MSLIRFYPLSDINGLHRQMNRLFDEITSWENPHNSILKPAIELLENDSSLTLKVLLPGINKNDVDISVTREVVKISGEYHHQKEDKNHNFYIAEFNYGKFERTINLPVEIQNEKVTANYQDGILTLNLPKVEEVKNKVFKVSFEKENPLTLETNTAP